MHDARWRLTSLWVSQVARVLADWCLRMLVILTVARHAAGLSTSAWHLVTAVFIAPFILLSPFNGAISNGLPKRGVLIGASGFCLLVVTVFAAFLEADDAWQAWLACLGLMAAGSAVYSPARYALLPAAARDTQLPLTTVNGLIEMGGSAAIIGGMVLGLYLDEFLQHESSPSGVLRVLAIPAGLNLLSVLMALPVRFPSDVCRPESPVQAVAGFFRDTARVLRDQEARAMLLGLAGFLGLLTAGSGALVGHLLGKEVSLAHGPLRQALILVCVGAALGCVLAGLQGHLRRSLGLVPLAVTGLLLVLAWETMQAEVHWLPCLLLGVMGGVASVPLRAAYQAAVPADARGNGMAVMNFTIFLCTTGLALAVLGLVRIGVLSSAMAQLGFLAVLAGMGALLSWYLLFPPAVELLVEVLFWPLYRIYGHGSGLKGFPLRGPLLLIANHTAWVDPLMLMKVLPRRLTPMMTSVFYDKPGLRWLMKHAAGAIRVPAGNFRRETPELDDAVAALDRGACVLIFPEGWLKRETEQLLRLFGQGVWHILQRRPETPVVACWIEGGWGSYTSHKDGPPMVNKPVDFWRRIDVAVREPEVLDPALLADQKATRQYLMDLCLQARADLGLPLPETPPATAEAAIGEKEPVE